MNNTLNEEAMKRAEEMLSNPEVIGAFAKQSKVKNKPTDKESLTVEKGKPLSGSYDELLLKYKGLEAKLSKLESGVVAEFEGKYNDKYAILQLSDYENDFIDMPLGKTEYEDGKQYTVIIKSKEN